MIHSTCVPCRTIPPMPAVQCRRENWVSLEVTSCLSIARSMPVVLVSGMRGSWMRMATALERMGFCLAQPGMQCLCCTDFTVETSVICCSIFISVTVHLALLLQYLQDWFSISEKAISWGKLTTLSLFLACSQRGPYCRSLMAFLQQSADEVLLPFHFWPGECFYSQLSGGLSAMLT